MQALVQRALGSLSPLVREFELETDHSPKTCADVKNAWTFTPTVYTYVWDDGLTNLY